jgi:hypothetical protein
MLALRNLAPLEYFLNGACTAIVMRNYPQPLVDIRLALSFASGEPATLRNVL